MWLPTDQLFDHMVLNMLVCSRYLCPWVILKSTTTLIVLTLDMLWNRSIFIGPSINTQICHSQSDRPLVLNAVVTGQLLNYCLIVITKGKEYIFVLFVSQCLRPFVTMIASFPSFFGSFKACMKISWWPARFTGKFFRRLWQWLRVWTKFWNIWQQWNFLRRTQE